MVVGLEGSVLKEPGAASERGRWTREKEKEENGFASSFRSFRRLRGESLPIALSAFFSLSLSLSLSLLSPLSSHLE